jgi:predicted RNA-binding protein (virulence factor B family)
MARRIADDAEAMRTHWWGSAGFTVCSELATPIVIELYRRLVPGEVHAERTLGALVLVAETTCCMLHRTASVRRLVIGRRMTSHRLAIKVLGGC